MIGWDVDTCHPPNMDKVGIMIEWYQKFCRVMSNSGAMLTPFCRRFFRFLALPYWYFTMVDWDKCEAGRWQVASDFVYIFFVLKYFPEHYNQCRLWRVPRGRLVFYYGSIYDAYQRRAFDISYSRPEFRVLYGNKDICGKMCRSLGLPHVESFGVLDDKSDYRSLIENTMESGGAGKLLLKPVRGGGGKDIKLIARDGGKISVRDCNDTYGLGGLKLDRPYLLQPFVEQHPQTALLNSGSLNTVRIVTMMNADGEALPLIATFKTGIGDAYLDNASRGGLCIKGDLETGKLVGNGHDNDALIYERHPDTGIAFDGYQLPIWDEVRDLARKAQQRFDYSKLLGLDIAFTQNGPLIIEINYRPDLAAEEQIHGPLLEIREIWDIFRDHNLLINRPSRNLYTSPG